MAPYQSEWHPFVCGHWLNLCAGKFNSGRLGSTTGWIFSMYNIARRV